MDLVYVGELDHPTAPEGASSDALTSTSTKETAEASVEASGSTTSMPPLKEDMEVGNVDSPVRTAEDELLNDSDQEDSQAQEAGDVSRETSAGVTAGLSELSVSSPRAQPTPESEGPTTSTPQGSASNTAPPEAE